MKTDSNKPTVIEGGFAVDDRGTLSFANDFHFSGVKRFYVVENFSKDTVRAFHGHMKEHKYVFVVSGSAIVATVALDDPKKPSKKNPVSRFVLSARKPTILSVPAGYANGFKALEEGTKIMFFSSASIEETRGDDYRFPSDYWGAGVWEVENR